VRQCRDDAAGKAPVFLSSQRTGHWLKTSKKNSTIRIHRMKFIFSSFLCNIQQYKSSI
jgi:hypothetical protein